MRPHALRGPSRRVLFALLFSGAACTIDPGTGALPSPASSAITQPSQTGAWQTTAQLIHDPAIQKKVDTLVARSMQQGMRRDPTATEGYTVGLVPTVDAESTGDGGGRSAEWLAYVDLTKSISLDDAKALLHHESPAIRVYFASYVAYKINEEAPALIAPLLLDTADVTTRDGCVGQQQSVGEASLESLVMSEREHLDPARRQMLTTAVNDERIAPAVRGKALGYLVNDDPKSVHALAIAMAQSKTVEVRREGVKALALIADPADIALIGAQTKSVDAEDREVAANALGKIDSRASVAFLTPLLQDAEPRTQEAAGRAYGAQSAASDDVLRAQLSTGGYGAPAGIARGLAERGTLHALALLQPQLMSTESMIGTMELEELIRKVGQPAIPITRDLLGSQDIAFRDAAMRMLGELHDVKSIPALRKLLVARESPYIAADVLGELGATEAADDLVSVLDDENANTRISAAKALVKLRAIQTIPALEKAASTDTTFAKPQLVKAVAALKAL